MNQSIALARLSRMAVVKAAAALLLLAGIVGFLYWFLACPCGRTPGGYLLGEESQEVIADWSFVNEVTLCQLQTRAFLLPHSINLNCSSLENDLFIGCMNCEGKNWGAALTEQGVARIRINNTVYPVNARRLMATAEKDHAWLSSSIKAERAPGTPRPPDNIWWAFHLTSSL